MKLGAVPTPDYFDLTKNDVNEIRLIEIQGKDNCEIISRKDNRIKFKGFKLTNNPKVDVCCDVSFYRSSKTSKYVPRLTFIKVDKLFNTKEQEKKEKVRIEFNDSERAENFWKIISFLYEFKNLVDVGAFDKNYSVIDSSTYVVEFDSKEQSEKVKELAKLANKVNLSDAEIQTILLENRQRNLKNFNRLLIEKDSWKIYQKQFINEIKGQGEEAVWHHFLKTHLWFLGLNLHIKFIRDLIYETELGIPNTDGRGSPSADFLGISDYTVLIELKTPKTKIFTEKRKETSRANTWSFSNDFIDGISQCLGQKFDWDTDYKTKNIVKEDKFLDKIRFRTIDPKIIFIIGNKEKELPEESKDTSIICKRDTFERFRRNCRNVEIITFDELYERAFYLVNNHTDKTI